MKYIVQEIQTFENGTVSTPAYAYDTISSAERQFHMLVAGAVVSELPVHTIIMMTNDGRQIERKSYRHEVQPTEEVTEDEQPEA